MLTNLIKLSFVFCFSFISVFAEEGLTIKQYPNSLKEDEVAEFSLKSQSYNLNETNIVWKVAKIKQDDGIGRTTFKYKTPKLGTELVVTAQIFKNKSTQELLDETSFILRASPFFIMYEGADSYTPAFYKGRALPAKEGITRISAISLDRDFDIKWEINDEKVSSIDKDKKVLLVKNKIADSFINLKSYIYKQNVLVDILQKDIKLVYPEVLAYVSNENSSILNSVTDKVSGANIYIKLEPLYFSVNGKDYSKIKYTWKINNSVRNVKNPSSIKLSSDKVENAVLDFNVLQSEKITQNVSRKINIEFK